MFSSLQYLGPGRSKETLMNDAIFQVKRKKALILLQFAIAVCELQKDIGGYFLHEHPWGADSWLDSRVTDLLKKPNVWLARGDQCRFD